MPPVWRRKRRSRRGRTGFEDTGFHGVAAAVDPKLNCIMGSGPDFKQRTDWAEHFIAQLASQPLVSECVYHSPQRTDKTQKEVVDLLLVLGDQALVLSIKCQQDPGSRSRERETAWAAKATADAAHQIGGALRALRASTYWCDHPRRGKVQFSADQLHPTHAVVLVETSGPTCLPDELPLRHDGVLISYFSADDFCYIVEQLRSIPEIVTYLDARSTLPPEAMRSIGNEKQVYGYYLLNGESLAYCLGPDDAGVVVAARADELRSALARKAEADRYSGLIERVADCLAERNPEYLKGLTTEEQALFDAPDERRNYLLMQEELCNLRLADRALIGRHLANLMERADKAQLPAMTYAAAHSDSKPDFVYVVVSARGESRVELIRRARALLLGAMAFYDKPRGMSIVDRDGTNFEVVLYAVSSHSITAMHLGEVYFGKLRMDDIPATLVPRPGLD